MVQKTKKHTTQTHMFSCLLTLLRRTSSPGKTPLCGRLFSIQQTGRTAERRGPPRTEKKTNKPRFLAPTSSCTLEVNQTDLKRKKNQATTKKKKVKSCHKIWNIWKITPANNGSCCFLLVYAKVKDEICIINDIPVFSSFV